MTLFHLPEGFQILDEQFLRLLFQTFNSKSNIAVCFALSIQQIINDNGVHPIL